MSKKMVVFTMQPPYEIASKEEDYVKEAKLKLTKALACLGVKPSTFHSLVTQRKLKDLETLLRDAMAEITGRIHDRHLLGNHLDIPSIKSPRRKAKKKVDYKPHVNKNADFPTILESYQYLLKKYVINPRRYNKAKNVSNALSAFKSAGANRSRRRRQQEEFDSMNQVLKDLRFDYEEDLQNEIITIAADYEEDTENEEDLIIDEDDGTELTFEVDENSARITQMILDQFKDVPEFISGSITTCSSSSRRSSFIIPEYPDPQIRRGSTSSSTTSSATTSRRSSVIDKQKAKTLRRRKSLLQIQNSSIFQPKEEKKLLMKYVKSCKDNRRPSSVF